MSVRRILVPLAGHPGEAEVLGSAFRVARRFQAHVEAFYAAPDPRDAVAFVGEGMTSGMIEQIMAAAEHEGGERGGAARKLFERLVEEQGAVRADTPGKHGFSAGFTSRVGREDDLVAERGRLADLIVAAKPQAAGGDSAPPSALEAALREAGRPVLVVPGGLPESFGRVIAIAWNGSVEVSRSLALALPFLESAERVVVLSVEDDTIYGPPAEDAVEYLAWHGIAARSAELPASDRTLGQTLLAAAAEAGADIMVQGAYTRSRMRRLIFGGVTGEVLAHMTIPVLMTH